MRPFPQSVLKEFPKEFSVVNRFRVPGDIQDFLNTLPMHFTGRRHTYASPLVVLETKRAHCMEGAMLAAAALWRLGYPPLLLDLTTTAQDDDHVVALFKKGKGWGAISKTNHAVLRYRDPVYRDPRELAMSYFNEYFLDSGVKTMRGYSAPFDLLRYGDGWLTSREDLGGIAADLDASRHYRIIKTGAGRSLRRAEPIEIEAGKIVEWGKKSS